MSKLTRACLFGGVLAISGAFAHQAMASDPLAGDAIGLPPNISIALLYNQFSSDDAFTTSGGTKLNSHSTLTDDVTIARFVHTFDVGGYTVGVQAVEPYVAFLGTAKVEGAPLTKNSGFAQPLLGVFTFPINNDAAGESLAIGGWIIPPVSSYNASKEVTPSPNVTTWEADIGFHQILLGDPKGQNLSLEGWDNFYSYGINKNAAGGAATYHEEPTDEVRAYASYVINPAVGGYVAAGLFQSFGGKQTLDLHAAPVVIDTGNRTNETQLRFFYGQFVTPTLQLMGIGEYDVEAHGGFLNRSLQIRIAKFF
jgi:hypothetical protein